MFLLSWINIHDILSFYPKINTFHKTSFHIPLLSQQFDLFYRFQSGLPVTDSKYFAIHVNYCGFIKVDPRLVCQEPPAGWILYMYIGITICGATEIASCFSLSI